MNPQIKILAPIGLLALALVIYSSAFIINQWEVAIKLRLGEIVDSGYKPGLHFMVPIINNVKKFDGRIQTLDSRPQRFLTIEKKDVIVDSYAKWRITNPGQFYRSTGGDSERTARLLAERINTGLRDEFGRRTIQEVVSEDRFQLMNELTKSVDRQVSELGIEVVDVRVKKIDLPPEVSESVYERMRAERERVARDLRAKGGEAAERIRADADRQRTVIVADAYKLAEEARGEGDAKATQIYAKAYTQNPNFYSFYRSLNAYRSAFGQGGDVMVLRPDSEFFRYFNEMGSIGPAGLDSGLEASPTPAAPAPAPVQAPVQIPVPVQAPQQPMGQWGGG
jgi:membrane protease subunit HflC